MSVSCYDTSLNGSFGEGAYSPGLAITAWRAYDLLAGYTDVILDMNATWAQNIGGTWCNGVVVTADITPVPYISGPPGSPPVACTPQPPTAPLAINLNEVKSQQGGSQLKIMEGQCQVPSLSGVPGALSFRCAGCPLFPVWQPSTR